MAGHRAISYRNYNDGTDRWSFADAPPSPALTGAITGYSHYVEHAVSFTARREMPCTTGVLIINFGERLDLVGGNGETLTLAATQGFVAGLHTRPAISRASGGRQSGVHVFLPLAALRRLLRTDMEHLLDRVVSLDDLFGPEAASLGASVTSASSFGGAAPRRCADSREPNRP